MEFSEDELLNLIVAIADSIEKEERLRHDDHLTQRFHASSDRAARVQQLRELKARLSAEVKSRNAR